MSVNCRLLSGVTVVKWKQTLCVGRQCDVEASLLQGAEGCRGGFYCEEVTAAAQCSACWEKESKGLTDPVGPFMFMWSDNIISSNYGNGYFHFLITDKVIVHCLGITVTILLFFNIIYNYILYIILYV